MSAISVIVPTLNEVGNIQMLVERIAKNLASAQTEYEILFIDDHSNDGTPELIAQLQTDYPVRCLQKQGSRGKAYSLLEGFAAAEYDIICMIDADLQYPPEAIMPMYQLMKSSETDIVITNRLDHGTSRLRKITSDGFNLVFTKMLFGFDYDSQSGLKLFKKKVIDSITLTPTPWSFDLEFIVRSLEQNFKIVSYDITFAQRYTGVAKIQVSKAAIELAKASIKLRFTSSPRKVKRAYKNNLRIAEKAMVTGLFALVASTTLALNGGSVSALNIATLTSQPPTNAVVVEKNLSPISTPPVELPPAENPAALNTTDISAPVSPILVNPVQPVVIQTSQANLPVTAPTVVSVPTGQPTDASAPPITTHTTTAPNGAVTFRSTMNQMVYQQRPASTNNKARPSFNDNGFNQSQVLGASTTAPSNISNGSDLATFPGGSRKTAAFSYTNRMPSHASTLVRPLAIAASVILLIGIIFFICTNIRPIIDRIIPISRTSQN